MRLKNPLFPALVVGLVAAPFSASAEDVFGTGNNDFLLGGAGASKLYGSGGDDRLYGDPVTGNGPAATLDRVSVTASGQQAEFGVVDFALSADGRRMAFSSTSAAFLPGQANGESQIYLKDMKTGAVTLVTSDATGGPADGSGVSFALSPDGKSIAFDSSADNLPGLPALHAQIIVKNLQTGIYTLVSHDLNGNPTGVYNYFPAFSPDGTLLVFENFDSVNSGALIPGDTNKQSDIYVARTSDFSTLYRVSTTTTGGEATGGGSYSFVFSPDSKSLAFSSTATNLIDGAMDANGTKADVFLKELTTFDTANNRIIGKVTLLSTGPSGQDTMGQSSSPAFSPDGREVAFVSGANSLVSPDTNTTGQDLFIKTIKDGGAFAKDHLRLVSRSATGAQGNNGSYVYFPVFSPDGKKIAFKSNANNLPDPVSYAVYVKDLSMADGKGSVATISKNPLSGETGDASSFTFHPDGTQLFFMSEGGQLVKDDTNNANDIFRARLSQPPGGDDVLDGGAGADFMVGGTGNDTYLLDNASDFAVEQENGGIDTAQVFFNGSLLADHVENLVLNPPVVTGSGNDLNNILTGNTLGNALFGLGGNDTLIGSGGADTLDGGAGNDTTSYASAPAGIAAHLGKGQGSAGDAAGDKFIGIENLIGSAFNDTLVGSAGANALSGGAGNDKLTGGLGKDVLTGGAGADRFIFTSPKDSPAKASKRDVITDFSASEKDLIDLSTIDAQRSRKGNQAFNFIGNRAFSGAAGQLRFAKGVLYGDTNGDRKPDFAITVTFKNKKNKKLRLKR